MIFGPFCFYCSLVFYILRGVFNKTSIPFALVGYEMIIANSHLISNANLVPRAFSLVWGPPNQGRGPGNEVDPTRAHGILTTIHRSGGG